MKTIYDFVYCDSILSQDTIFYQLKVGISKRDQRALRFVRRRMVAGTFILCPHCEQFMQWLRAMESRLFSVAVKENLACGHFLRQLMVPVTWLASFLRHNPPQLLNSLRIETPWSWLLLKGNRK